MRDSFHAVCVDLAHFEVSKQFKTVSIQPWSNQSNQPSSNGPENVRIGFTLLFQEVASAEGSPGLAPEPTESNCPATTTVILSAWCKRRRSCLQNAFWDFVATR